MKVSISLRSLRAQRVRNKFNLIILLIIVILLMSLLNLFFSVKIMSGIRAYVGGEGLWSKGQKEALTSLISYVYNPSDATYANYTKYINIPLGDKVARLELDKPNPNYAVIRAGFIQGGNDPNDVDDLVFLYRQFHNISYMKAAITIWANGDQEIINFMQTANQIHQLISSMPASDQRSSPQAAELAALIQKIYRSDTKLTTLENQFSATLGTGSRNISRTLLEATVLNTLILGALTLFVSSLVAKGVIRLDKLKSEFVSLASHQLRTPLTAVNWYAEALTEDPEKRLSDQQRKYLHELSAGGHRMTALIDDLLKMSSLDLGTYKLEPTDVDINKQLQAVLKDVRMQIDQKEIHFESAIDPQLPTIKADEQMITALLQNLLTNAIKYTPAKGTVRMSVTQRKSHLLVAVSDNGIGVPKSQQEHLFSKLFRADNAKLVDANGTGLGLYIVRAIAQRMGGSVWFHSEENKGSTFYVKLPL